MRTAAVGFHCPSCVVEGAKTTRTARTAYGGALPGNPALTSQVLIAVNAAVWLLITVTGGRRSVWLDRFSLLPGGRCQTVDGSRFYPNAEQAQCVSPSGGVTWVSGVADGAYWQLLTSVFTHVDLWHIGFNMLALWFLGPQLEMALGRVRFLLLYFVSGLVGSVFVYWLSGVQTQTAGASGAVFGLMGGLLVFALKRRADVSQLLVWIGLNFVITVLGSSFISWQGHLGGFVGGAALAAALAYAPRSRRPAWQAAGIMLVVVLSAIAVAVRTLALSA